MVGIIFRSWSWSWCWEGRLRENKWYLDLTAVYNRIIYIRKYILSINNNARFAFIHSVFYISDVNFIA